MLISVVDIYKKWLEIVDKAGDPFISGQEWSIQFNLAVELILKDDFQNIHNRGERSRVPYSFENTSIDLMKWKNQIIPHVVTATSGNIGFDAIQSSINREIFQILAVEKSIGGEWIPVRYVRHNDKSRLRRNAFKKPIAENPFWHGDKENIVIEPSDNGSYRVTLFVYPIKIRLDEQNQVNNIDSDLSTSAINSALMRMAQLSAIKIREQQLYEMASQQEVKQ